MAFPLSRPSAAPAPCVRPRRWSPGTPRSGRSAGVAAAPARSNGTRSVLPSPAPVDGGQGRSVPRVKGAGIPIPGPTTNRSLPRVPQFIGRKLWFPQEGGQLGNIRTAYGERIERAGKAETEGRSRSSCLLVFPSSTAKQLAGFNQGCCMRLKIKCCEGLVADRKL